MMIGKIKSSVHLAEFDLMACVGKIRKAIPESREIRYVHNIRFGEYVEMREAEKSIRANQDELIKILGSTAELLCKISISKKPPQSDTKSRIEAYRSSFYTTHSQIEKQTSNLLRLAGKGAVYANMQVVVSEYKIALKKCRAFFDEMAHLIKNPNAHELKGYKEIERIVMVSTTYADSDDLMPGCTVAFNKAENNHSSEVAAGIGESSNRHLRSATVAVRKPMASRRRTNATYCLRLDEGKRKRMYERHASDVFMSLSDSSNELEYRIAEMNIAHDPPQSPPRIDSVEFSVMAQKIFSPGEYMMVDIFMYVEEYRKEIEKIKSEMGQVTERRSGYKDISKGAKITVMLSSDSVKIENNIQECDWSGKYSNFNFAVKVPDDFTQNQILFTARVLINGVPATDLSIICERSVCAPEPVIISRHDIKSAFVSYSSKDRETVAILIIGILGARPDLNIFFDVTGMHHGQAWEKVLKEQIEARDTLFLCWSKNAKESEWVDKEWRYAYSIHGIDGITPLPLVRPENCRPPEELADSHFNSEYLYIYDALRADKERAFAHLGS